MNACCSSSAELPTPTFWPSQTQWSVALEMSLCHSLPLRAMATEWR